MNKGDIYTLFVILIIALITFIIRATPFIFFGNGKETPKYITYLGKHLPSSVIAMLIIYCLKSVNITSYPFGLPELAGIISVVFLHLWKRNNLISIIGGTVIYMIIVQAI